MTAPAVALDIQGPAAPPRSNGELVFAEPWESRIFGVTLSLHEAGRFEWSAFQGELIAAIGRWEASHEADGGFNYYVCWLDALETLLQRLDMIDRAALQAEVARQRARPAGHDHGGNDHGGNDHGGNDHGGNDHHHGEHG